ncbi:MAG: ABC transporter permease [Dehalococcoidia bacterium]|nr:ABC transporter permease [Dehalococcoidia bacterium]
MATQATELEPTFGWGEYGALARTRRWTTRFIRTQPLGTLGFVIILLIVFGAIFADYLHTSDPTEFGNDILAEPGADHFFGTNREGQDVWSRVLYGARPALQIGVGTVLLSVVLGGVLALLAGFVGGTVDTVISRLIEIFICLPAILWAMVLATSADDIPGLERGSVTTLVVAISIGLVPVIARILRGNVIQEKNRQYVEAARVIGANEGRIMFRHILPNLAPLIIVVASATLPAAILAESGLSFLGIGRPAGDPGWGADLGGKARSLFRTYWWLPVFPGVALSLTVLAFNLLGDSLRDVLDPRLRGTGAR